MFSKKGSAYVVDFVAQTNVSVQYTHTDTVAEVWALNSGVDGKALQFSLSLSYL